MPAESRDAAWPDLPYAAWQDSCATLQLMDPDRRQDPARADAVAQPFLARAALRHGARARRPRRFRTARAASRSTFDFVDHASIIAPSDGARGGYRAASRDRSRSSIALVMAALDELGLPVAHRRACRTRSPTPIPFGRDTRARRLRRRRRARASGACCVQADRVFKQFRTGFLGKASPVHFFWGSFDLAVTRFSGRAAPPHPGGVPAPARLR